MQEVDERGSNALHYLAKYHGHRHQVLLARLQYRIVDAILLWALCSSVEVLGSRAPQVIELACKGDAGAAASNMTYGGKDTGLLPLHILCRYSARQEKSIRTMVEANPRAVGVSDDQGILSDNTMTALQYPSS